LNITLEQLNSYDKEKIVFVDTRGEIAYSHGHIDNAVLFDSIKDNMKGKQIDNSKVYIIYCTYGEKSVDITLDFRNNGYEAYNLEGGLRSWLKNNTDSLSNDELLRYDRQIILPELGIEGQTKLKNAKVLIVGAGGLGAPVSLYLAGAGIGHIGILDQDDVSMSNLQRQIIFEENMVGKNKADMAKSVLEKNNHNISVKAYKEHLTPENAESYINEYDFVVDAVDNFETKFLINDTCVLLNKPFCHAGILGFKGQVMTYVPNISPCYRCVFEEIPDLANVPTCSTAGVIGAIAGIIGSIQALEVVKYFADIDGLLTKKIFTIDGLTMRSRIIPFPNKNDRCRVCGKEANIRSIEDNKDEYRRMGCNG